MTKHTICILLFFTFFFTTGSNAQNLVKNGSAEMFDSITKAPLYWTGLNGAWISQSASTYYADSMQDGLYMFFAQGSSPDTLQQDVDVSSFLSIIDINRAYFSFSGYVQSYPQGPGSIDQTRIIVECLNSSKTTVLQTFDSDTISSPGVWQQVYTTLLAPSGTRYMRIWLIAIRRSGFDDDGYFDAISLTAVNHTGINNMANSNIVSLYPNPVANELTIEHEAGYTLTIYDLSGKEVYKTQIADEKETFDVEFLNDGMYVARMENVVKKQVNIIRIVKQPAK